MIKERLTSALRERRNRAEWENESNWSLGFLGIYSSSKDARLIVPKRNPMMGWTINFGHRSARWIIVGLALIPLIKKLRA